MDKITVTASDVRGNFWIQDVLPDFVAAERDIATIYAIPTAHARGQWFYVVIVGNI